MSTQKVIEQREAEMPQSYRRTYRRAMTGTSKAAGVKAFCLECCGWSRNDVANCTAPACPLYPYRPYRTAAVGVLAACGQRSGRGA